MIKLSKIIVLTLLVSIVTSAWWAIAIWAIPYIEANPGSLLVLVIISAIIGALVAALWCAFDQIDISKGKKQ